MSDARINLRMLDALRGALAVYVVAGHCRWLLWAGHAAWMASPHSAWLEPLVFASASFRYGREAVMVFFALSGFFIHLRYAAPGGADSSWAFARRRLHRLGPPYYFALVVTVLLDSLGRATFPALYQAATGDALIDDVMGSGGYTWQSVAPALALLPSSLRHDFGSNGPLWSLAYEVVYYAIYPGWLGLRRISAWAAYGVIPAMCLLIILLPSPTFFGVVLLHYPVWLAGAAVAELLSAGKVRAPQVAAAALFAFGFTWHVSGRAGYLPTVPAMLYGAAAVTLCATMRASWVEGLPVRLFEYLGVRSYSIYITHFPFVALLAAAVMQLGGRPLHGWFAAGGAIAATLFGCVCFALCERQFVHRRIAPAKLAA